MEVGRSEKFPKAFAFELKRVNALNFIKICWKWRAVSDFKTKQTDRQTWMVPSQVFERVANISANLIYPCTAPINLVKRVTLVLNHFLFVYFILRIKFGPVMLLDVEPRLVIIARGVALNKCLTLFL